MKLALVAPPWLPVPPTGYGGIEWVVANLADGLTKIGVKVLLFAPGDSVTSAELYPQVPVHLGQDWPPFAREAFGLACSRYSFARAAYEKTDLIHDHTLHYTDLPVKVVHTLHGPATEGTLRVCRDLSENGRNYFVAISDRQRELYGSGINFAGTVYNGIDAAGLPYQEEKEDFLLFIGRANWEKGLDLAVRVAVKAKKRLVLAVKMSEEREKEFFKKEVQPWLDRYESKTYFTLFEELTPAEKYDLYRRAQATLFTSQWEEPFGLVMLESMACGTPVYALRRGAAPEVIVNGTTGFVVKNEDEMVQAVGKVSELNPKACREHVLKSFSIEKMVKEYKELYNKILT